MLNKITFNKSVRDFILAAFEKSVDNQGYIIEKKSKQRVIAPDGLDVQIDEFGGVRNGSLVFIKSDLPSLVQLCDDLAK